MSKLVQDRLANSISNRSVVGKIGSNQREICQCDVYLLLAGFFLRLSH